MAVRGEDAAQVGHRREHMPCLDGLRGLAAVMVVLGHAKTFGFDPIIVGDASYGVLIFFALSGFLMGDLYLPGRFDTVSVRTYLASRIARIVPIFYLIVTASFFMFQFADRTFVYNVSPVQLGRLLTFNGSTSVFWSVAPEIQFYFVFVLLWFAYDRLRTALWLGLVLVLCALCLVTIRHWPGILIPSKFHIFACGMVFAVARVRWLRSAPSSFALIAQSLSLLVLVLLMTSSSFSQFIGQTHFDLASDPTYSSFYGNPTRTLLSGFVVFSFAFVTPLGLMVLANPLAALLGRCSFSIYLLHEAVYDLTRKSGILDDVDPRFGTIMILAATIVLSTLTYRFIEAPSRRWLRDRLLRLPLQWASSAARVRA